MMTVTLKEKFRGNPLKNGTLSFINTQKWIIIDIFTTRLLKNVPLESISSTQKPTTTPPVAKTRGRKKRMLSELESSLTSPPALQQKHHKPSRKGTEAQSLDVPPKRANIFGANSGNSGHTFQAGSSSGSSSHDSILSEHASEAAKLALRSLFQ
jgi:hypothetical protein